MPERGVLRQKASRHCGEGRNPGRSAAGFQGGPDDNPAFRKAGPAKYPSGHPMKQPCVYIMSSGRNGTLYVGVSSDLVQRVWQHKNGSAGGFTKHYKVKLLVWYEVHGTMESAIKREKALKRWYRAWKIELIEESNPGWVDLYDQVVGMGEGA